MRWTRGLAKDERELSRTAKSCGPGAPMLALSFARTSSANDGGKKPVTGESSKEAVKPSRRESRIASAEPVCSCAFSCAVCTRDRGCSAHPAFPAPSSQREGKVDASLGRIAPRECGCISPNRHPRWRASSNPGCQGSKREATAYWIPRLRGFDSAVWSDMALRQSVPTPPFRPAPSQVPPAAAPPSRSCRAWRP